VNNLICSTHQLDTASPYTRPLQTPSRLPLAAGTTAMVLIENQEYLCEEEKRLKQDREREAYWKRWGPYVAERQWATGQCRC
jgi:hypothetical protein